MKRSGVCVDYKDNKYSSIASRFGDHLVPLAGRAEAFSCAHPAALS
ncbi:unnamed protein product, partial [Choristocarpus tenellus]